MAATYVGVGGVARYLKECYVGIGGAAREVKEIYVGVGGVPRLAWSANKLANKLYCILWLMDYANSSYYNLWVYSIDLNSFAAAQVSYAGNSWDMPTWIWNYDQYGLGANFAAFTRSTKAGNTPYTVFDSNIDTLATTKIRWSGPTDLDGASPPALFEAKLEYYAGALYGRAPYNNTQNIGKFAFDTSALISTYSLSGTGADTRNLSANSSGLYTLVGRNLTKIVDLASKATAQLFALSTAQTITVTDSAVYTMSGRYAYKQDLATGAVILSNIKLVPGSNATRATLFSPKRK